MKKGLTFSLIMEKRLLALVMLAVCVVSLTSCSTAGTYYNTKEDDSYIQVSIGSNETKGKGYVRRLYCKSRDEWMTGKFDYDGGKVVVHQGLNIYISLGTAGFSVDKSTSTIKYSGYEYKK